MALNHAKPGEIIDVSPFGDGLAPYGYKNVRKDGRGIVEVHKRNGPLHFRQTSMDSADATCEILAS